MEEREANERKSDGFHRRVHELFTSLSVTLAGDYGQGDAAAFDKVISRVRTSSHPSFVILFFIRLQISMLKILYSKVKCLKSKKPIVI